MGDQANYLPRYATGLLQRALDTSPVVVLMGARQTGKSTLVQCEPFLSDRLYLTLDAPETHERARLAPADLLRSAQRITLDEVQREPGLLLAVKHAVDEDGPRRPGRFLFTGSANPLLMRRVSESLAGRATYITLWPLARRERLGVGTPGIWSRWLSGVEEPPAQHLENLVLADLLAWRDGQVPRARRCCSGARPPSGRWTSWSSLANACSPSK